MKKTILAIALALGLTGCRACNDNVQDMEYIRNGIHVKAKVWNDDAGKSRYMHFKSGCYVINAQDGPRFMNHSTIEITHSPEQGCQDGIGLDAVEDLVRAVDELGTERVVCTVYDNSGKEVRLPRSAAEAVRKCYDAESVDAVEDCFRQSIIGEDQNVMCK